MNDTTITNNTIKEGIEFSIRENNSNSIKKIMQKSGKVLKTKIINTIIKPLDGMIDNEITDVVTTIGSFGLKIIRGKFQRSISFTIGIDHNDGWLEEALYGILYKYNNIKKESNLNMVYANGFADRNGLYYKLGAGTHSLKYRNFDILLLIENNSTPTTGRIFDRTTYTLFTYNLDPSFVTQFEKDMMKHRDGILRIQKDSPVINIYKDLHENDGYTYWEKFMPIQKRKLNTIYLPSSQKKLLVNTLNNYFSSRKEYIRHGIPWNLKIILYGGPGGGKDSIAKMIASEYNRNIYYITGGKNGKFIPHALLSDNPETIKNPLYLISDMDKYPFLINETNIDLDKDTKEDSMAYKQLFGQMINSLDGIMSGEGKIIIITTNHIEKFSPTFLRPGRIDLKLHIDYVVPDVFRKYVYDFYGKILPKDIELKRTNLTIADMNFNLIFLKQTYEEFVSEFVK